MTFPKSKFWPLRLLAFRKEDQRAIGIQLFWIVLVLLIIYNRTDNSTIELSLSVGPADVSASLGWWSQPKEKI